VKPVTLRPGIGDDRPTATLHYGQDVRETLRSLPEASVHTVCTSPPYWGLRDYGRDGQIGLEESPGAFADALVDVFREIKRVLRPDGTAWLNLGDSYAGGGRAGSNPEYMARHKEFGKEGRGAPAYGKPMGVPDGLKAKDLVGIPWRVAFALQADGWYLRSDIIWAKGSCMPESVTDRPTRSHEYVFLLSHPDSGGKYFYDFDAVREPAVQADRERNDRIGGSKYIEGVKHSDGGMFTGGQTRNKRTVWNVNPRPYSGAHFAVWPPDLVRPMVLAGCPVGGTVLDPFSGSGTTGMVALQEGRNYIGIDLNEDYLNLAVNRVQELPAPQPDTPADDGSTVFDLFGDAE